jgi:hypothetical protein
VFALISIATNLFVGGSFTLTSGVANTTSVAKWNTLEVSILYNSTSILIKSNETIELFSVPTIGTGTFLWSINKSFDVELDSLASTNISATNSLTTNTCAITSATNSTNSTNGALVVSVGIGGNLNVDGTVCGLFSQNSSFSIVDANPAVSIFTSGIGSRTIPASKLYIGSTFRFDIVGVMQNSAQTISLTVFINGVSAGNILSAVPIVSNSNDYNLTLIITTRTVGSSAAVHVYWEYTFVSTVSRSHLATTGLDLSDGMTIDIELFSALANPMTTNAAILYKTF